MRTAYMDEIRKKLAVFAESTKNHFDMDFNSKLKHSIVELDNIEEYDITFNYINKETPQVRQVYTISRVALENRFVERFGTKFRGIENTTDLVKKEADAMMAKMQQDKAQPDKADTKMVH